jgi:ZIP family zinc transporter
LPNPIFLRPQVFISLVEVLPGSTHDLKLAGMTNSMASFISFLLFFGGIILCYALDLVTDSIMGLARKKAASEASGSAQPGDTAVNMASFPCGHCNHTPNLELGRPNSLPPPPPAAAATAAAAAADVQADDPEVASEGEQSVDQQPCYHSLMRTSLLVGLAISLHNLPEGLATFVGYMSDPKAGILIAISIALHNIPEGIAIAVPVYYATGSKLKAILWAGVSGLAEPIGALIGLAIVLSGQLSFLAMGIIMALIAGIMTGITFRELLPRAMQYDPSNRWTTNGIFAGMAIMAVSWTMMEAWA